MIESNIREQFKSITEKKLHYLDSAATTLKPMFIAERVAQYYNLENGNPHRGAHELSVLSTELYECSKQVVKRFVGAGQQSEVIYTKNATESLNLIAASLPRNIFTKQDNIVIYITAHHSNILPWQRLCRQKGAELVYLYCDENGQIPESEYSKINHNTKLVSLPLISNGNGAIHPAEQIFKIAKKHGAITVADAAQAVGHETIDFEKLGCDFLAFSAHKVYGPQGLGVLVGKRASLEQLEPYVLGGDMIEYVTEQSATFADIPERFEAGTQNVAGAVGLMAALEWLEKIGLEKVIAHNKAMTELTYQTLLKRLDVTVYGPKDLSQRGSLVTFNFKNVHPHDVATILDSEKVAIRAGHHCCQPLMKYSGTLATCRASIGIYTNEEDIKALNSALDKVAEVFGKYA